MKYVLAIIFVVFVAIGFAAYGVKSPLTATQRDAEPEAIAARLDHINDELKKAVELTDETDKARALKQCVLFIENEASTLRQFQR